MENHDDVLAAKDRENGILAPKANHGDALVEKYQKTENHGDALAAKDPATQGGVLAAKPNRASDVSEEMKNRVADAAAAIENRVAEGKDQKKSREASKIQDWAAPAINPGGGLRVC